MDRVAIISQKGGTGNTTLACSLAVAARMDGLESVIFDADPLVPAMVWATERKERPPDVIPIYRKELLGGFMSALAPKDRLAMRWRTLVWLMLLLFTRAHFVYTSLRRI